MKKILPIPTGPLVVVGINVARKQMLVLKQNSFLPLIVQGLLKMLILSGEKLTFVFTRATPLDLKIRDFC